MRAGVAAELLRGDFLHPDACLKGRKEITNKFAEIYSRLCMVVNGELVTIELILGVFNDQRQSIGVIRQLAAKLLQKAKRNHKRANGEKM